MREREAFLERLEVEEVWGIAKRWGQRLRDLGGTTAASFARLPDGLLRKHLNVVGLRTAYELRGVSCLPIEHAPAPRKSLVRSRSFGEPVTAFEPLREAVSTHAARAAEKLRREGLAAGRLHVFATTKEHGAGPHKTCAATCALGHPTNRTPELIRAAVRLLEACYEEVDWRRRPYRYQKAGVTLTELTAAEPE
jgi:DNA polymerase V